MALYIQRHNLSFKYVTTKLFSKRPAHAPSKLSFQLN